MKSYESLLNEENKTTVKYSLNIGLDDKDLKKQIIPTNLARQIVIQTFLKNDIEGFTIYDALGCYKYKNGEITQETSFKIDVLFFDNDIYKQNNQIINVVKQLLKELNQESIAVQREMINSDLIDEESFK